MNCIKLLGQSLKARELDRQVAEIQIRLRSSTSTRLLAYLLQRPWDSSVWDKGKNALYPIWATKPKKLLK